MRRRLSSEAATTRAREASRSLRLWAFAIAVPTSSMNSSMRSSLVPGGSLVVREKMITTPEAPFDLHGAARRVTDALLAAPLADPAGRTPEARHPGRPAGLEHLP
jgi:hypothetical protein